MQRRGVNNDCAREREPCEGHRGTEQVIASAIVWTRKEIDFVANL